MIRWTQSTWLEQVCLEIQTEQAVSSHVSHEMEILHSRGRLQEWYFSGKTNSPLNPLFQTAQKFRCGPTTYQLTHSYTYSNTDVPLTYHIRIYYTAYKRYFAPKNKNIPPPSALREQVTADLLLRIYLFSEYSLTLKSSFSQRIHNPAF